jgi:hypothetical protein
VTPGAGVDSFTGTAGVIDITRTDFRLRHISEAWLAVSGVGFAEGGGLPAATSL